MKLQNVMLGLLALAMVSAVLPAQATTSNCPSPSAGSGWNCDTATGPGSVEIQGLGSLGVGLCNFVDPGLPIPCDAGPSASSGAGAASFATNGFAAGNHYVSISIDYAEDFVDCDLLSPFCGYSALVCNDRDLDSTCTNIGDLDDQLWTIYSNEPAVGSDCDASGSGSKDTKSCNEPTNAGGQFCMTPDINGNWGDPTTDQIVVFIGVWVGEVSDAAKVGAGLSAGTYHVGMRDDGVTSDSCGGPGSSVGGACIWSRDAVTETLAATLDSDPFPTVTPVLSGSGSCSASGGFACSAGDTVLLALVVGGPGSSTTANGCGGSATATSTVPLLVAADVVTPTTATSFTCDFTWEVAAIGACLTL